MDTILSIETGTNICSVALSQDDKLISLRESEEGRHHARNLAVFVDEIFEENRLSAEDLSAVAIGKGPGSYTGLRIGVSLAKGLCYGAGVPLIAVNSLEALARVALEDHEAGILDIPDFGKALLCPMIDARRMEVYAQVFDTRGEAVGDVRAEVVEPDSFAEYLARTDDFVIFGNGAAKCREVLTDPRVRYHSVVPSARGMVGPAYEAFREGRFEDVAYFEPFYLKDFVAGVPKRHVLDRSGRGRTR